MATDARIPNVANKLIEARQRLVSLGIPSWEEIQGIFDDPLEEARILVQEAGPLVKSVDIIAEWKRTSGYDQQIREHQAMLTAPLEGQYSVRSPGGAAAPSS